jgi:hypothetical protein
MAQENIIAKGLFSNVWDNEAFLYTPFLGGTVGE